MSEFLPTLQEHFLLSRTGLSIEGQPSFAQWEEMGGVLGRMRDCVHWAIGDWIIYGEGKYGEKYAQALEDTGYAYSTLKNDVYLASRFEKSRRRDNLPWSYHREVAKFPPERQNEILDQAEAEGWTRAQLREVTGGAKVGYDSRENEWYTPEPFIEAARLTMGGIDLDPASTKTANSIVKAARFFSAEEDGLAQKWAGRVWLSPPDTQPLIEHFCLKLVESVVSGSVTQACVLVNNATETSWFQGLAEVASTICFPRSRMRFWHPDKDSATPLQGQAVLYVGKNSATFAREFSRFGFTAAPSSDSQNAGAQEGEPRPRIPTGGSTHES